MNCIMKSLLSVLLFNVLSAAEIKLISPENGETVRILRSDWREVLKKRTPSRNNVPRESIVTALPVDFQWNGQGELIIAKDPEFKEIVFREKANGKLPVYNLEKGREYYWQVTDGENVSIIYKFATSNDAPRFIYMENAPLNMRDIGGKTTVDGKEVRQGMLYRGGELDGGEKAPQKNLEYMVNVLKIKCDLDLRYVNQVKGRTGSELGQGVRWLHHPVNAYKSFTPEQNKIFRDAVKVFADIDNYPIYVHCSGGADRTGEIIFLIEQIIGVSEEDSLIEYELTSMSIYPRDRNIQYFVQWREHIRSFGGENMAESVKKYLLSIGVTTEDMNAIRQTMLK